MQKKSLRAVWSLLLAAALVAPAFPGALAAGEAAAAPSAVPAAEGEVKTEPAAGGETATDAAPDEEPDEAQKAAQEQLVRAVLQELAENGQLELPAEFELDDYADLLDMAGNVKVSDLNKTGTAASFIGADMQPYFRLRDLAYVFAGSKNQFNVGWDGQVVLTTGAAYDGDVLLLPLHMGSTQTQQAPVEIAVLVNGAAVTVPAVAVDGHYYLTVDGMNALLGTEATLQQKQ